MIAPTLLLLACLAFGVAGVFQCRRLLLAVVPGFVFFVCMAAPAPSEAADCTGVTAGASADCPVYVNLLGPLGPASAASAPGIVDGPTARYSFMWGFGAVMGMGFLGFAVAAGVSVIRKG